MEKFDSIRNGHSKRDEESIQEKKILKEVCAWCKKELGEKEGVEEGVTHGICPECSNKVRRENNLE
jgi:DNA-directed RNA polymerase subunit RPC12/RpoP